MQILVLIVSLLSFTTLAQRTPITWLGSPNAKAIDSIENELIILSKLSGLKSTQFLYQKNTQTATDAPLVSVIIKNQDNGREYVAQTGFDMISQNCSCYWLDADDILERSGFSGGSNYAIIFRGPQVELKSGKFGLEDGKPIINNKPINGNVKNDTSQIRGNEKIANSSAGSMIYQPFAVIITIIVLLIN